MKFTRKLHFRLFIGFVSSILIIAEKSCSSRLYNENSSRVSSEILSDYDKTAGTIGIRHKSIFMKNIADYESP